MVAKEGEPFKLGCQPPDGWPKPNVHWVIQVFQLYCFFVKDRYLQINSVLKYFVLVQDASGNIRTVNNSRMTVDPEGNLWFSNVTVDDASDDSAYACTAVSYFRFVCFIRM